MATTWMIMELTEIAWAAGFFDGEGSTGVNNNHRKRLYVYMKVTNTFEANVERFSRAVLEGYVWYGGYKVNSTKPFWEWKIWGMDKATKVCNLLWPFLGLEKKFQIERAFELAISDRISKNTITYVTRNSNNLWGIRTVSPLFSKTGDKVYCTCVEIGNPFEPGYYGLSKAGPSKKGHIIFVHAGCSKPTQWVWYSYLALCTVCLGRFSSPWETSCRDCSESTVYRGWRWARTMDPL